MTVWGTGQKKMISKYKAIFFDAGGTLLHPYPSVGEIYVQVAARHGCSFKARGLDILFRQAWLKRDGLTSLESHSNEKVERDWWRSLVHEIFETAGGIADFENFFNELYHVFGSPEAWRLYPDVPEILDTLKARGKKLAIISNWDSRLFKLCDGLQVREYFDFVLASAVFGASKPSPKIFTEALQKSGVAPEEAVHIGDSYEDDIKGAHGVGMKAILIERTPKRHFPHIPIIRDLKELLDRK